MRNSRKTTKTTLLTAVFASGIFVIATVALAQTPAPPAHPAASAEAAPAAGKPPSLAGLSRRANMYYQSVWGVDSLKVKYTESGEIIRFSYRIVDPDKAAPLNDKKSEPALYDPKAGVKLKVPQMEKVGQLRQSSTPIEGKTYWMAFSNSGRRVRPGDRVILEIGHFHADGLVVE